MQKSLLARQTVLPHGWDINLDPKIKAQLTTNEAFVTEETYDAIFGWYDVEVDNTDSEAAQLDLLDQVVFKIAQLKQEDNIRESFIIQKISQAWQQPAPA